MAYFQVNGTVFILFLFHEDESPRPHFVHELLVNVLLHHALAQFLAESAQLVFGESISRHTQSRFPASVTRKHNRHTVPSDGNPLVAPEGIGDYFTFLDL